MQLLIAMNWIDGQWVDSEQQKMSINPANYEFIGRYADGGFSEAQAGIEAARKAFDNSPWKHDRLLRSDALLELADAFERNAQPLINFLALESGKIKSHAEREVMMVPSELRYYASVARTDYARSSQPVPGKLSLTIRQPLGVAGIIVPWHLPVALLVRSLAPALAAGCTVVVKMSGQTAQTNALVARILAQASSLPKGVINLFNESGTEGSQRLIESPLVPIIRFAGSTITGRVTFEAGAKFLKRFGLGLSGKTPMVIFADADLDAAVPKIVEALTLFSGQSNMTGSRILVHQNIAHSLIDRLTGALASLRIGAASDAGCDMGPLIDKECVSRVDQIVEGAIADGAKVLVRGGPITDGKLAKGAFYSPTLLQVYDSESPILHQEVFGPVITIQHFSCETEAIKLSNSSEFRLAASVWTRDIDLALRASRDIQAGTIWINDWAAFHDECEQNEHKQPGIGYFSGMAALDDFIEHKNVALKPGL